MYALFPGLAARRTARAQTLSGGERQMLAVASALALEPRFVLRAYVLHAGYVVEELGRHEP